MSMSELVLDKVFAAYDRVDVLSGVSLVARAGRITCLLGSNGAGKSTLLNSIAGRLGVDSGTISIDGKAMKGLKEFQRARYVGRVFQDPLAGTAPDLTIEENLALAAWHAPFGGCAEAADIRRGQGLGRAAPSAPHRPQDRHV